MKKWKILEIKDISPSKWFPLYKHKIQLHDGKIINNYFVSDLGNIAMILPITKEKEIVFVRQYKHGIRDFTLELPAGRIEDLKPVDAAFKELKEETGIITDNLLFIGEIFVSPTKDSMKTYGYITTNVSINSTQELDITEDIDIEFIKINRLDNMIKKNYIKTADTLALIYLARLNYPDIFLTND